MIIFIFLSIILNIVYNNIVLIDNNYILSSFIYIPLIVLIYPYFKNKKYLFWVIIISMFASANSYMLLINISLFSLLSIIIKKLFSILKNNVLSILIINNYIMLMYSFLIGLLVYLTCNAPINYLIKPFYNTFIINNMFIIIFYFCSKKIRQA